MFFKAFKLRIDLYSYVLTEYEQFLKKQKAGKHIYAFRLK